MKLFSLILPALFWGLPLSMAYASPQTLRPVNSAKVMPLLNAGWSKSFDTLERALTPEKDYVTWLIEVPGAVFDMRSAELFHQSINGSDVKDGDSDISHMMVAWQCHDDKGDLVRGATGFTGENLHQSHDMIFGGWGMTTFAATFTDGELNTPADVEKHLTDAQDVAHITFEVARGDCQKMLGFLKTFIDNPRHPGTRFGFNLDPAKFEGGGCGSFAVTMVEQAGLLGDLPSHLWTSVKGSLHLMGRGLKLPVSTELHLPSSVPNDQHYVLPLSLQRASWGAEDGPAIRLVDPEMGLLAMRTIALEYVRAVGGQPSDLKDTAFAPRVIHGLKYGGEAGNVFDEKTTFALDEKSSAKAADLASRARTEYDALVKRSMKTSEVMIGPYWGLLITLP